MPGGSLHFWRERLTRLGVPHHEAAPTFGEPTLALFDPDGLPLALVVAVEPDPRVPWTTPEIDARHAARGFHGVTLSLDVGAATAELLIEVMGYEHVAIDERVHRYARRAACCSRSPRRARGSWSTSRARPWGRN